MQNQLLYDTLKKTTLYLATPVWYCVAGGARRASSGLPVECLLIRLWFAFWPDNSQTTVARQQCCHRPGNGSGENNSTISAKSRGFLLHLGKFGN